MINDPGCCKPVACKVACDISTRGPKLTKLMERSGSLNNSALTLISRSPSLALSPGARPRLRSKEGSAMTALSASASVSPMSGEMMLLPTSGHWLSTALSSTSLRAVAVCSMARICTTCETAPKFLARSTMLSSGGVCRLLNSISPPSRIRALSPMPLRIDSATDPTVPMAATPNSKAPKNTRKRPMLPRISRRANCQAKAQLDRLGRGAVVCVDCVMMMACCHVQ